MGQPAVRNVGGERLPVFPLGNAKQLFFNQKKPEFLMNINT
jgi:hypothetical protein